MSDDDQTNGTIELSRHDYAHLLATQQDALELEVYDQRRRYFSQPVTRRLTFGAGQLAQQTLLGDEHDRFHGAAVFNPTGLTVYVGLSAGSAVGSPYFAPPFTLLVLPGRHSELSLAVSATDAQAGDADVTVMSLRVPPSGPALYPYGAQTASGGQATIAALTANSSLNFGVTNVSQQAVPANAARKGLSIENNSTNSVTVAPGSAPVVAGQGMVLSPGGSWDGRLSSGLWTGSVQIIAAVAGPSSVAVIEG